jgi:hypothetical protein
VQCDSRRRSALSSSTKQSRDIDEQFYSKTHTIVTSGETPIV